MRCLIAFLSAAVLSNGQVQNSGYENAEQVQPAPAPVSADGGDQQAYNSDAVQLAPASPSPPSPPPPPPPPAPSPSPPVQSSYASPPPASYPPMQGSYGTSLFPTPLPLNNYGPTSDTPVLAGNGIGYRKYRVFRHRVRSARL